MNVYEAIAAITASLSKVGIAKGRKTQQGGGASFSFRGIDDVLNALSPLLAEHKLCIFPRITNRASVERQTKSGGAVRLSSTRRWPVRMLSLISIQSGAIRMLIVQESSKVE